jgi:hypothetical protein
MGPDRVHRDDARLRLGEPTCSSWIARGGLALAIAAVPRAAHASADVWGASVTIARSGDTADCPDEDAVVSDLRQRLGGKDRSEGAPERVDVALAREGDDYTATIRVQGPSSGVRVLRSPGPTCARLANAMKVVLLVVFDANASEAEPTAPPGPARPPAASPPPPGAGAKQRGPVELWAVGGGALTHGLPVGFGGAALAGVDVRVDRWDIGASAHWTPDQVVQAPPGSVLVRVWGGELRVCIAATPPAGAVRLSGCAWGLVSALRGEGRGFPQTMSEERVWGAAGTGLDLSFRLLARVAVGAQAVILSSLHREVFTVEGLGTPFETDPVVGWVGGNVALRFW